ncbi:mechanosensitive ion channel domain-containing protein [Pseudoxanthomonas indica]|uniref:Mechanosensitive ion channel n=1 Tax=Pseudoxanthomonas indica TaxID=428993 RepID=A0A1T5KPS5_9GAMM|nr:mechanosensitive ion channel family protein [Pseudoxanthomonas indica]GGD50582.1 hypothetical protein GCM10007235_23360 [Pseudoxanthomonas indica]SKC65495.1 Mechanosensitive ion channel [Pseudoxanthomonas indica]
MIMRALWVIVLVCAMPVMAQESRDTLDARIAALRQQQAAPGDASADAKLLALMQRQLLTSLERRRDLEQSRADAARVLAAPLPASAPLGGLLERDDLRRQVQEQQATAQGDSQRLELLKDERDSAALRLANRVAAWRSLADAGDTPPIKRELAHLDMQLSESVVAEIDLLAGVLALQRDEAKRQRSELSRRLSLVAAGASLVPTARDEAELSRRLQDRQHALQLRLEQAMAERERARAAWQAASRSGTAGTKVPAERLVNADMELDLTREAQTNLSIEQAAWQLALRLHRDADASALIEAREQGPRLQQRLQRRRDFLTVTASQLMDRMGALDTLHSAVSDSERVEQAALRAVLDLRLRRLQLAVRDARQTESLLERLREDFEERLGRAGWREQLALRTAAFGAWLEKLWDFELFAVNQSVDVDGRKTTVARGVTVGKLVKAPLLLVLGLLLSFRLTAWAERRARRRGVDEARARLVRRWTLGVLVCAWTLASLALAGIPLAAFAFAGGAIAIGVGFGTQNLFKNLISGILVLIERPFRLGDVIEVGALRGTVIDIDLRTSVVRDGDGAEILIPNSILVEQSVRNLTFRSRSVRQTMTILVDPRSEPREVMDTLREVMQRHGQLLEAPTPVVQLVATSGDALTFVMRYWLEIETGVDQQRIASDLRLMVLSAFAEAGIRQASTLDPTSSRGHTSASAGSEPG